MTAVTLWLLMSLPTGFAGNAYGGPSSTAAPTVVARFASRSECERVSQWLTKNRSGNFGPPVGCIEATVYPGS